MDRHKNRTHESEAARIRQMRAVGDGLVRREPDDDAKLSLLPRRPSKLCGARNSQPQKRSRRNQSPSTRQKAVGSLTW